MAGVAGHDHAAGLAVFNHLALSGDASLGARSAPEQRPRLVARAPAGDHRPLPDRARRRSRAAALCPSSARSAATSWRACCTGSIGPCRRSGRAGRDRPAAAHACWTPLPDPAGGVARARIVASANPRRNACSAHDPVAKPLEASLRDPGVLAAVDRALQVTVRPSSPCGCRDHRRAPSGSRSCRSSCARTAGSDRAARADRAADDRAHALGFRGQCQPRAAHPARGAVRLHRNAGRSGAGRPEARAGSSRPWPPRPPA